MIVLTTIVLAVLGLGTSSLTGSDDEYELSIMAMPTSFVSFPGHAFMLISVHTRGAIKEEALGFYPYPSNPLQAFIGGPGLVSSEFQKDPKRFTNVTITFMKAITWAQRKSVYELAKEFNSAHYQFNDSNCIDFVDRVARSMTWKTPSRSPLQTPEKYVSELARLNP